MMLTALVIGKIIVKTAATVAVATVIEEVQKWGDE